MHYKVWILGLVTPHIVILIYFKRKLSIIVTLFLIINLFKIVRVAIRNVTPSYILKDYINAYEFNLDDTFVGFYNLNDYEKSIIRNLIHFMNQNKTK